MKRRRRVLLTGVLTISICIVLMGGCSWFRRTPDLTPTPANPNAEEPEVDPSPQVAIPDAINQGTNQEPELQVYLADKKQVQSMNMEEYIQGVVAAEMDPTWHKDALAAQAIIARSFTLQKIAENGGVPARNAHASTDIKEFQAYDASRINENVRKAVEATRGEVAVYENQFIRGWFHAYAGPRTATATEGLEFDGPNPSYIHVVDSPAEDKIPEEERDWQASFPVSRIRNVVKEITGNDPGAVTEMEIADKGPSGRVTRFRVNDVEVSAPQMRLALDSTVMRSTYVNEIKIEGNNVSMAGTGYGHGVGMCQWGARTLAEEGKNPEEIVDYYYKDINIIKLWE